MPPAVFRYAVPAPGVGMTLRRSAGSHGRDGVGVLDAQTIPDDPMIRVAIFDRHPAVRAGLRPAARAAGLRFGGLPRTRATCSRCCTARIRTCSIDDLELVRRVKLEAPRTRVLLYVADPAPELLLAAEIAGADGVIDKAADTPSCCAPSPRRACCRRSARASGRARRRGWIRATARSSPCAWPARPRARSRASSGSGRRAQRPRAGDRRPAGASGSRPPALIVFIVNCDVMRASPGRSANVLIRKCSYASASATATRIR